VSPTGCLTWALVIVVVSFCSGYQLAGYLEAEKAERAATALQAAREALAASRGDATAAHEFAARLLTEAVLVRSEREAPEPERGAVELTVTALWRPASDQRQQWGTELQHMTRQTLDRPEMVRAHS